MWIVITATKSGKIIECVNIIEYIKIKQSKIKQNKYLEIGIDVVSTASFPIEILHLTAFSFTGFSSLARKTSPKTQENV